ncbi:uncharacterized protein NEMAJ01_0556 [Nematocida major]|uniref:uncharacterized protein n=1 Tax=Nematocida major TaxID=1912982 RepID=UPI002007D723|nr:uncharacterized protein NEMAJ01_0556 [Nematocida major]KAH9385660.1 hypothetical protein NEMAJ01_0556 [Nematocida major]
MVCSVGIFYYKRAHSAGELISGYITLHVPSVMSIESIVLTIDKESEIRVDELEKKTVSNEKVTRHLGRFVIYGDRTGRILPGMHKFPFSFRMAPGEGATIEYKKIAEKRHIYALNKYISKCEVKIYGIFKPVASTVKELCMIEAVSEEVKRTTYRHSMRNCLCFSASSIDLLLAHDSVLYAGQTHALEISTSTGASISRVQCSLEMRISSFTNELHPVIMHFPCQVVQENGKIRITTDETLPSETTKNDFFSISYRICLKVEIKGEGSTEIRRSISIRSKSAHGEYSPPEVPESAIYPEKYLSLRC